MTALRAAPDTHENDDLGELPPLDGDARDAPEPEPEYADLLEEEKDDATLDDSTAEDEPADADELDLNDTESGWLNEAADAHDLDLGEVAIFDFGHDGSMLDQPGEESSSDEDFGFGDAPERGGLDAGEEGPLDADEELHEADLPALDADEEGDVDDAVLVDPAFASDEPLGLPWAAEPWLRVGAPVALAGATAVACAERGALVLGRLEGSAVELVHVDLEGACDRLGSEGLRAAEVRILAVEGRVVAAVTQGGRLHMSLDGGSRFAPVVDPIADGVAVTHAVLASGRLWVCTRAGGLLVSLASSAAAPRSTIERCPVPGIAAALTRDAAVSAGDAAALVVDDKGRPTALVHCAAGKPVQCEMIDAPEARSPALLAVRGKHAAYAARHGSVVRRVAGGAWVPFQWEGSVTALAFVDDLGTLACATYCDADDTTAFVRVDPSGHASIVARVGGIAADSESDGRVAAMAHDEARGVIWVVGGFGLTAFAVT